MKSSLKYRQEQHALRLSTARVGTVPELSRTSWNELSAKVKFLFFCEFSVTPHIIEHLYLQSILWLIINHYLPSLFVRSAMRRLRPSNFSAGRITCSWQTSNCSNILQIPNTKIQNTKAADPFELLVLVSAVEFGYNLHLVHSLTKGMCCLIH